MESGDEDDAFTMGEKEWQKMNRNLSKQGYRDGKNEGREKGMQQSFEMATALTLKYSLKLGQLQGFVEWQQSQPNQTGAKEKLIGLHEKIASLLGNFAGATNYATNDDSFTNERDKLEQDWKMVLDELINECIDICPDYASTVNSFKVMN